MSHSNGITNNRVFLIARREFVTNIKRRSFLFTVFGLPLLIVAIQFGVGYLVERQGRTTGTLGEIGYVDQTRERLLRDAVAKPEEFRAFVDEESARAALVAEKIGAYFVVPPDYVKQGIVHAYGIKDIPRGIEGQMSTFLTDNLLVDWPPERARRLQHPLNLSISTLEGDKKLDEGASVGAILMPLLFAMLFIMSVFTTSGFMMQGVVEEKENRLVEILMTSITPLQLLWGKILGLGGLGFLQVAVWGVAGGLVLSQGSNLWAALEDVSVPSSLLLWSPFYLLLGYLFYGALLAGIGASVTSMQEGQQTAGIVSFVAVVPTIGSVAFIENANGPFPTITSLIPFTSPVAMMMRLPFADVPLWQIILSLSLLALTTLLVVWIAAQAFRIGLLMYGKRLGPSALWKAFRQGLDIVPAKPEEQAQ